MNNKVKFLRGTATEYEASTKDNDTFYYTTDDEKLYLGNKEITGGGVTIDDTLSDTSKNPVQNKVINAALNSKANLSDIPTTLPANGGNADTVGNLPASSFLGLGTNFNYHWANGAGSDVISSVKEENHLFAFSFTDTPTAYGFLDVSSFDGTGFSPAFGLVRQIWTDWENPSERFVRIYKATSETDGTWTDWSRCNADTLDGKHASEFVPYHSYAPIYTGDILDIPEMGTYSCPADGCTNLPSEIASWCYVTAFKFRDAGYKRFICVALNDVSSYPCVIWLASESNKTSDGKLIWSKANDGGNADTVDGKHASDLITHYGLIDSSSLDPNTRGCWDANITGISIGWANVVQFENGHFITQIAFGASMGKTCSLRLRTRYATSEFESWESDWNYIETVQNAATANTAGTLATTASNVCLRNISAGTGDLTAGSSPLATGAIYLVYE